MARTPSHLVNLFLRVCMFPFLRILAICLLPDSQIYPCPGLRCCGGFPLSYGEDRRKKAGFDVAEIVTL